MIIYSERLNKQVNYKRLCHILCEWQPNPRRRSTVGQDSPLIQRHVWGPRLQVLYIN